LTNSLQLILLHWQSNFVLFPTGSRKISGEKGGWLDKIETASFRFNVYMWLRANFVFGMLINIWLRFQMFPFHLSIIVQSLKIYDFQN